MRALLALFALLPTAGPALAYAQADYYARLGVTWSTAIIRDNIVEEIEVTPQLAPTLALGASLPIAPLYRAGIEAAFTTSGYQSSEAGIETDLGTLRTGAVTLGLDGPIARDVRWRAGGGIIAYWPSEKRGIFLRGGTRRFVVGAGADYRRPVMVKWDLLASLRYDFHRFTTDELEARGFSQTQGVHRISVSLGLARAAR
jgi:hypothetical protein